MEQPHSPGENGNGTKRKKWKLFGSNKAQNGKVLQLSPDQEQRQMFYQDRMVKLKNVLQELGLYHLQQMFVKHDIGVENIPELEDGDFSKLGVSKIGDKIRLKRRCTDLQNGITESKDFYKEEGGMDVVMGERSSFQLGDRDNHVTSESIINAERIDQVGQNGAYSKLASSTSTKISMGANSKFDAGNKNNNIQSSTKIDAAHLQHVGGMGGIPGIPGMGGPAGNVNINMGHGASLQGLGMNGYDSKHKDHESDKRWESIGRVYASKKVPGYMIYEGSW